MSVASASRPRFRLSGDQGILVELGESIDPEVNRQVRCLAFLLDQHRPAGILNVIPAYRSLLLVYEPTATGLDRIEADVLRLLQDLDSVELPEEKTIEIPVCYGGEHGPDIDFVAEHNGLNRDEVVRLHSQVEYPIYMLGFTPGFPYLGGLDARLHTPRRQTPRTRVPQGSVGIANAQTGIYPVSSPGGWQLIGRTPIRLFRPGKEPPVLYQPGDRLRFKPIAAEEYSRLCKESDHA